MKVHKIQSIQALRMLRKAHPDADPNVGFIRQLKQYEKTLVTLTKFQDTLTPLDFACRDCREPLFSQSDFEEHTSSKPKRFTNGRKSNYTACSSYFLQQLSWFGECFEVSGLISCPSCSKKLGDYNWSGRQCSCGKFVSPAFQIHHSAIDELSKTHSAISQIYIANPRFS